MTAPTPWQRYGPAFTGTRPVLREGDPGIDAAWLRRRRWGQVIAALWVVVVPVALGIGLFSAWGPFGWAATWQLATFGFNSAIWLIIPLLPLAFLPLLVARMRRIGIDTPFLLGMRQSFDADWGPRLEVAGGARTIFRQRRQIARWLAAVGGVVLAVAAGKGWHDAAMPHALLPEIGYARLANAALPLPTAARVIGAVSDHSREWTHDYTVRRDAHRDVYYALEPTGGRSGPVAVVEKSSTSPHYETAVWNMADPPGPREGMLTMLDAWTAGRLRAAGFALAPRVVVVERRQLHGRDPDPDPIADMMIGVIAASVMVVSAALWWGAWLGERRLAD